MFLNLESATPVPHPRSVAALGLLLIALIVGRIRKGEIEKEIEWEWERGWEKKKKIEEEGEIFKRDKESVKTGREERMVRGEEEKEKKRRKKEGR